MTDIIVVFTTMNSEKEAKKLAYLLVEEKLAACVNLVPKIKSFYEWDGEVHNETEHLLIIKAPRSKVDRLRSFIDKVHPYEVPEFVALNVEESLPDYMQWVKDVTS